MAVVAPLFVRRPTAYGVVDFQPDFTDALVRVGLFDADGFARLESADALATGRAPTRVLALPGRAEKAVLRWLRHGGLIGPWLRGGFVGVARPRHELIVNAALRAAGAPVPAPLFCAARRTFGPVYEAVFATVLETQTQDALTFLTSAPTNTRVLSACAAAGRAVRRFHDAGGRHADLHLKNLLLRERTDGSEVIIVDLDRARANAIPNAPRRLREIARLDRSLTRRGVRGRVGARGVARFFAAYCDGDRTLRRALVAGFSRERRRLAWHAIGYRFFPS